MRHALFPVDLILCGPVGMDVTPLKYCRWATLKSQGNCNDVVTKDCGEGLAERLDKGQIPT